MKVSLRNALLCALLALLAFCCGLFADRIPLLPVLAPVCAILAFLLVQRMGRSADAVLAFSRAAAEGKTTLPELPDTPLAHAVRELQQARVRQSYWYESILNSIPDAISVTDMDMRWTFCNTAALNAMCIPVDQYLGKHCSAKGCNICNTPRCGIEQLRHGTNELHNAMPDGRTMHVRIRYLQDKNGQKIGHVEISRDISAEQRLRNEAAGAARDARLQTASQLGDVVTQLDQVSVHLADVIASVQQSTRTNSDRMHDTAAAMQQINGSALDVAKNADDAAADCTKKVNKGIVKKESPMTVVLHTINLNNEKLSWGKTSYPNSQGIHRALAGENLHQKNCRTSWLQPGGHFKGNQTKFQ